MTEKRLAFSDNVEIVSNSGGSGPQSSPTASYKSHKSPMPNGTNAEGYFVSSHTGTNPKPVGSLKRYEDEALRRKQPARSPNSPSRTPAGTYAPLRTPSSGHSEESRRKDDAKAQYLAQEKAYLQKIRVDLRDEYSARRLSTIGTGTGETDTEDDEDDDDSVNSDLNELGVGGLGGVGTSFDDEYMDIGSSYPFLEAGYSTEDLDNPEHFRERLEWQAMLSSVLTGEVVRSEKRRIRGPTENKIQDDDLWLSIRAKVCGRAVNEQKRILDYARANIDQVFEEFSRFKVTYLNDEANLESATEQVGKMLDKIEKCESLWRSRKAMRDEHKTYGSPEFQRRLDAVISWHNITDSINKQLDLMRKYTGNNQLDPTKPPEKPDGRTEGVMEETCLVESVLKQDNLTDIFEHRIHRSVGPLIVKAREATVEYSQVFVELGLPLFHERLSNLMSFPVTLIQEIIRMRLSYARKLVNPTMLIIDQMISDFQLYIKIGMDTLESNRAYTEPIYDKGWVFQTHADESFNETVLDCLRFLLHLLSSKFLDGAKLVKSYQAFKETEQLEQQYNFLRSMGRLIDGSDIIVAEQFSVLESKLVSRLLNYWETQARSVNLKSKVNVERWLAVTIENVRSFQRKLLRFYKILCTEYENSTEYTIQQSNVKPFAASLRESGHFLVYTGAFEKYGIYAIADPALAKYPEKIKSILMGYCRYEPPEDEQDDHACYVMIFCIQEPLVWEGDIVNIEVPYFDMELKQGRMRLISEGRITELNRARNELAELTGGSGVFEVVEESRSHLTRVQHELMRTRRLFFRLSASVINYACVFRSKCKGYDYQESVQNMFVFAREFGQRGINAMDVARRGNVAMKLINLCIEWVTFICDDCVPTDYKTFRWTVVALEFAMVMTRGVNIMAITDEQFASLRHKVAGCMTLLISHFDIMGARSKAAAMQKTMETSRKNKLLNIQFKDDDELMQAFREETLKKLDQLEEKRESEQLVGKVLDDSNTDTEFLSFVASSFSNLSIRWQQGQFIGGGAFGTVYAAVNLDTGGLMAVKEIRLQDSQSIRHVLKSIKDEMTVLEILNHPNIVQYYGVEVHRDRVFIFMEYCQGGSLAGLLEYGRIEDEQVIQIYALQMLEGLAYLHQSGIVHRDIKPENILLDHMGVVKFVDFGAAKMIAKTGKTRGGGLHNGKTKLNSMTGTPMYMSPEVITGSDSGKRGSIDIWSLGCCVLEMATGRRPWANLDNEWAIMYHIAAGQLPPLPSREQLSELGQNFLMRCLQRDPTKRPTAMELLNDPWIVDIRNAVIEPVGPSDDSSVSSQDANSLTSPSMMPLNDSGEWRPHGWQVPAGQQGPQSASGNSSLSSHSQYGTQTRHYLREQAIKIQQQYLADQELLKKDDTNGEEKDKDNQGNQNNQDNSSTQNDQSGLLQPPESHSQTGQPASSDFDRSSAQQDQNQSNDQ